MILVITIVSGFHNDLFVGIHDPEFKEGICCENVRGLLKTSFTRNRTGNKLPLPVAHTFFLIRNAQVNASGLSDAFCRPPLFKTLPIKRCMCHGQGRFCPCDREVILVITPASCFHNDIFVGIHEREFEEGICCENVRGLLKTSFTRNRTGNKLPLPVAHTVFYYATLN